MTRGTVLQGVVYSAAWIASAHGEDSMAVGLLKTAFKDWKAILRCRPDPYDLEKIERLRPYIDPVPGDLTP